MPPSGFDEQMYVGLHYAEVGQGEVESISTDIASLKGVYRNRITRVLAVFFLANLGSALGTWLAAGSIAFLSIR